MGQLAPRLRTAVSHSDVLIMVKDGSTPQHTQTQGLCLLSPRYITYSIWPQVTWPSTTSTCWGNIHLPCNEWDKE